MTKTIEDPVCHMQVASGTFPAEFAGNQYAFCSPQCRERFVANPRVYIGFPGNKAPAQEGKQVIKSRRFVLSASLDVAQAERLKQALLELMGVSEVIIDGDKIEIQYDLIQLKAEQIADCLESAGASLGAGWIDRLKQGFINYLEEVEIGSLEVENKKCCNKV
ncbi:MAG: YHS domain-containing protein [Gallionellaceae bacterium]